MKPETLKKELKKIEWIDCPDFEFPTMPASQGYLLMELVKRYKIPFKQLGYNMDIVAIKTKKQIMAWKDTGCGARFLGIINIADGTIEQHPDDIKPQEYKLFNSFRELDAEISKRDYNNILGLKAKITKEVYWDALEVLPPFKYVKDGFILSEALTDNLYFQYTEIGDDYFCEVVALEDEEIMRIETMR
jgi:hypothetical protein